MRVRKRGIRKVGLFILGYVIVLGLMCSLVKYGRLFLNLTASVPLGVWKKMEGTVNYEKGMYVLVDQIQLRKNPRYNEQYATCSGEIKVAGAIKQIAGTSGDRIEAIEGKIAINGRVLPEGTIYSVDRQGKPLPSYPLPIVLGDGELWMFSREQGYDSRYYGPVSGSALLGEMKPVIVW